MNKELAKTYDPKGIDCLLYTSQLLSSVTLGLAGIFWVNPYTRATEAELYAVLRQNVLDSGFANGFTLPGFGSGKMCIRDRRYPERHPHFPE